MKTFSHISRNHTFNLAVALALFAGVTGCGWFRKKPAPAAPYTAPSVNPGTQTSITPAPPASTNQSSLLLATTSVGKVAKVNLPAKFVVLQFPIGQLPAVDTVMVVYHGDAKTGEVKITGPTMDNDLTVADILVGTAEENDQVRGN